MSFAVVLNSKSGAMLGGSPSEASDRLERMFRQAGSQATVTVASSDEIPQAVEQAARSDADAVIIGGGDGTMNMAARVLMPSQKPMGSLPLGTFNLFARDLGIPLDISKAVPALARSQQRRVDVGEVNGKLFLCNSIMGMVPRIVRRRERLRGRALYRKLWEATLTLAQLLRRFPRLELQIDLGGGPQPLSVRTLIVSAGPYEPEPGFPPRRKRQAGGDLSVYALEHESRRQMLSLLASMGSPRWLEDRQVKTRHAPQLTITSSRARLDAVNDGEIVHLDTPLRYRIIPDALAVLVPEEQAE